MKPLTKNIINRYNEGQDDYKVKKLTTNLWLSAKTS
jgi:hypothetical protein